MKKPTPRKQKVIKAWAIVDSDGILETGTHSEHLTFGRKWYSKDSMKEFVANGYHHKKVIPCTITYELPPNKE